MKKRLLILLFLVVASVSASTAQTYIKTNALYWAFGGPNISLETRISKKFTYNLDLVYSPWEKLFDRAFVVGQFINEVRFYPRAAFDGFYVGGYGAWHEFKMSKWNYKNGLHQIGHGGSLGVTLGYQMDIAKRWNMDFYVGGGWQLSKYRGYRADGSMYVDWNNSGEWIPYKIGVAFSYRLNK